MTDELAVIIGAGGMGLACTRRLGSARQVLIADPDVATLDQKAEILRREGLRVTSHPLDVSDAVAVNAFAARAAALGPLNVLVHTAGRSPGNSDAAAILAVNLLGTVHVLDAFLPLARSGTAAVIVSSIAAYTISLSAAVEARLATASADAMLEAAREHPDWNTPFVAYALSKRANQLRAEAQAQAWGAKGARLLSVSPGVIATPMFHHDKTVVPGFEEAALAVPAGRLGTAHDIAAAIAWLTSPDASFVTGCDLRIDGGMMSFQRWAEQAKLTR